MRPLTDDECDCDQHRQRHRELVARMLPSDEWHKLRATGMQLPTVDAAAHRGDVIVVERGHHILACWTLLTLFHAEGLWIDPAERTTGVVGRHLLKAMRETAQRRGAHAAWITAASDDVARLAVAHGAQFVPGPHFVWPMEGAWQ